MSEGYMYVAETSESETSTVEIAHSDDEDSEVHIAVSQEEIQVDDDVIDDNEPSQEEILVDDDVTDDQGPVNEQRNAEPDNPNDRSVITLEDSIREQRRASVIELTDDEATNMESRRNSRHRIILIEDESLQENEETEPEVQDSVNSGASNTNTDPVAHTVVNRLHSSPKAKVYAQPVTSTEKEAEVDKGQGDGSDEEAECCPICFEKWENSGSHRLASLRCGHLFGQSCIEKWLAGTNKCPQCNAKAVKKDVRLIYAKALKMVDTSARDQALSDLDRERSLRQRAELESAELRLNYQMAVEECKRLREELQSQQSTLDVMRLGQSASSSQPRPSSQATPSQADSNNTSGSNIKFVLEKTLKISDSGTCRVLAYSSHLSTLCMSQSSPKALFPGYGVKKLSTLDFRNSQYIPLHSNAVRDVTFHADGVMLLSASTDKTLKLSSMVSNSVMQTYTLPVPVWACAFNTDDENVLYAGLSNGAVCVYDVRNTSQSVDTLSAGSRAPVMALCYLPVQQQHSVSGLLVGQLDQCRFYEHSAAGHKPHVLRIDGSVCSMAVERASRHVLLTYRPNARHPAVRHELAHVRCDVTARDTTSTCVLQPVHVFTGGSTQKHLTRSALIPHPTRHGNLLIAACDEATASVLIWEATSPQVKQRLRAASPVMDVCYLQDKSLLCSLTARDLNITRVTP